MRYVLKELTVCSVLAALLLSGCDTVEPTETARLVVQGFLDAGRPLPVVTLRQSRSLERSYPADSTTAARGAVVRLRLGDEVVRYHAEPSRPGRYVPQGESGRTVPPRTSFELEVAWGRQQARAVGRIPPPIRLDSVQVNVPEHPVESVLLDSLRLDTLSGEARQGFAYPVEVTMWWPARLAAEADSGYWVRPHLKPSSSFSSSAVDFFLQKEAVLPEEGLPASAAGRRQWTGVYVVPVEQQTDPLPRHRLRVSLLRSTVDYARFAESRQAPERREPVSNVEGALGVVAGISVDSVSVWVE